MYVCIYIYPYYGNSSLTATQLLEVVWEVELLVLLVSVEMLDDVAETELLLLVLSGY